MPEQDVPIEPGKGKLVYDKDRRTIVASSPKAVTDDMIRRACNAYGGSSSECEFEWMREALTAAFRVP